MAVGRLVAGGENSKSTCRPAFAERQRREPGARQNIRARTGLPSTTIRGAPDAASTRTVSTAAAMATMRAARTRAVVVYLAIMRFSQFDLEQFLPNHI